MIYDSHGDPYTDVTDILYALFECNNYDMTIPKLIHAVAEIAAETTIDDFESSEYIALTNQAVEHLRIARTASHLADLTPMHQAG
ncbi:hypothetical protein IQ266_13085 [filamentous cyanobacterium LEGE 11480]|uniref:Uncharacterized protein n=1 Tax=Romeriopsis navalis LEGE 11480 TaxID=2777977 RepID=A0A928VQH2_9CYAN|nr:hypothetical protein [Romeriopsis navalis]MBE9030667.1 hypothetical protein [Romeriopsis navalis LEGE 11480]